MEIREQLQRTLGNAYVLERELGGGGMSQVFVAEETALGRKVVVKVLPPGRTGDVNLERFKREIQVAARLQHAHIVPVEQALNISDPNNITDMRDPMLISIFNRRLGEPYEAQGNRLKAVEPYRKVIDVWKNADPELPVIVSELRSRVRRLSDNEGIPR